MSELKFALLGWNDGAKCQREFIIYEVAKTLNRYYKNEYINDYPLQICLRKMSYVMKTIRFHVHISIEAESASRRMKHIGVNLYFNLATSYVIARPHEKVCRRDLNGLTSLYVALLLISY